ncbi:hypothetical protein CEP12_04985, partial [Cylindrospermopsis raciborskii S14]
MWQRMINALTKWLTKIKNLLFKNKPPAEKKERPKVSEYTATKGPESSSEPPSSKPPNKKKVRDPFANARGQNILFTKGVLFEDPQPEINS